MPLAQTLHINKSTAGNVSRSESLKSERSDRRVSFNRDVGIKHIPRGQKRQAPPPPIRDEWDNYTHVHKTFEPLSSKELEAQAEELVKIVNQIECKIGKDKESQSLDRRKNNTRVTNKKTFPLKLVKRNNLTAAKSTPDISRSFIGSPKVEKKQTPKNNKIRRTLSARVPTYDSSDSESIVNSEKSQVKRYKSEPDIPIAAPRRNRKSRPAYQHSTSMPATTLYKDHPSSYQYPPRTSRGEYKSADNLTDIHIQKNRRIQEYKSADNLQSGYSSSDLDMNSGGYRKSNTLRNYDDNRDRSYGMRSNDPYRMEYKRSNSHNDNKPFNYIGGSSLSSVREVRKLSPTRDIPVYRNEHYEKDNRRAQRSTSREKDLNNKRKEDYSTKIIITSDPISHYDDDDAYETYQVGDGGLSKDFRSLGLSNESKFNEYRRSNNNMNISSIGVQTESIPKPPLRTRRSDSSSRYDDHSSRNELSSTSLVKRVDHNASRHERSVSPPTRIIVREPRREVVPLLSDTDESEYYHRNKDPLAKIRSQVKLRKFQEEREARERGEIIDSYYDRERNHVEYKNKMQPLTVDEVDKLEFEIDEGNRKSLLVAREQSPTKYYTEQVPLKKTENITRDQNYLSRKDRENIRTPSSSRDKSPSGFFSTLDRMKKGAAERGRNMLGRKDNKAKKKNKKIKIKFFYEPTSQNQGEDPLSRYTEYKGTSSDERASPVRHQEFYVNNHHDYNSLNRKESEHRSRENTIDRRREYRDISCSPTRNTRITSKDPENRDSYWIRERRDSSTERNLNSRPSYMNTVNNRYEYENSQRNNEDHRSYEREASPEYRVPYKKESSPEYKVPYKRDYYSPPRQQRHVYDSDDAKPQRNTDRKYFENNSPEDYRSRSRSSSPMREVYEPKKQPSSLDSEGDEKKNKMMRQRKKFFGVLRGEGRTKQNKPAPKPFENSTPKSFSNSLSRTKVAEEKNVQTQRAIETSKNKTYDARSNNSRDTKRENIPKNNWKDSRPKETNPKRDYLKVRAPSSKGGTPMGSRENLRSYKGGTPMGSRENLRSRENIRNYKGGNQAASRENLRYFGDKRSETGSADYRSLPNRKARSSTGSKFVMGSRRNYGARRVSPGARGSAGSSLQSSESEADSHGGSHASRASKASRVSTSSNRSVYLHATAVADIPVRRESDDGSVTVNRQAKKVNRSFSLSTPWKPKHYRDRYELDYDNPIRGDRSGRPKNALPPRPPRKIEDDKSVNRSKTIYKDSKLAGWLKKKKAKEPTKGI